MDLPNETQDDDSLYQEVCEILDTVRVAADQKPEISKTNEFLQYATAVAGIVRKLLLSSISNEDVLRLKATATSVLSKQLIN